MCAALCVHPNSMRGWMEKDIVCCLECPLFGGCLAITVLTVISVWCPLFKMVCPWRKNQHLCIRIYQQQFGLGLMAMDFPFLNLQTILLCTLMMMMMTVFLQTAKEQQPSASRDADSLPSTDSSNHNITEGELNDLTRDLKLPKNKAELLASRLQQWNLLHHSVKVTTFRTRNQEFEQFFTTAGYFTYCKDLMVWWMQCIWGTVLSLSTLMLQSQVLKQSSYTMEIRCLPFLWHMHPAQKKHIQLWTTSWLK